jgi:hypothetical protein
MKIIIKPDDIVKRCLWDNYVYYILNSQKEAEKILTENKEMEISERDALVIGLLKVIETDNLIHRFNMHVAEYLVNKSSKEGLLVLVRMKSFDSMIEKYMDKFPDYWTPDKVYSHCLKELVVYIDDFKNKMKDLEVHIVEEQGTKKEFYKLKSIKKLLKFNY